MNPPPIQSPVQPDLRALLDSFKSDLFASLNAHKIGTVQAFNPINQTVSVQISSLVQVGSQTLAYPLLTDCPLFILSGGGATLTLPIAIGDPCLVLFNDTNIDTWFATGNTSTPNTPRTHDLSDGIALVGIRNSANAITDYDATKASLAFAGSKVTIAPDGSVQMLGPTGSYISINSSGNVSIVTSAGALVGVGGSGKITMYNGAANLKTTLDALCDTLTSWVNTGGSTPNAATLTAIAAVKTQVDNLLL